MKPRTYEDIRREYLKTNKEELEEARTLYKINNLSSDDISWESRRASIEQMLADGKTLKQIGNHYGVSKQRIYQIMSRLGLQTPQRRRKSAARNRTEGQEWLHRALQNNQFKHLTLIERTEIEQTVGLPETCPILTSVTIDYQTKFNRGFRPDNAPALVFVGGHYFVMSWQAARVMNDGSQEEHQRIADFIGKVA